MKVKKIIKDNTFIDLKRDLFIDTVDGKQRVTKFYVNRKTKIRKIWIDDDNYIGGFTLNHRLLGKDNQWIYVGELDNGDVLLDKEGNEHIITKITEGEDFTFDIEVDKIHSYLLNNNIVSHNTISQMIQIKKYGDIGSGLEPLFSLKYKRFANEYGGKTKKSLDYINNLFEYVIDDKKVLKRVMDYLNYHPNLKDIEKQLTDVDKDYLSNVHNIFKTAMEISPDYHLKILEQVQYCNSSAVSKTINLVNEQTIDDVKDIYIKAMESPYIKGVTMYRDGSLQTQVLNSYKKDKKKEDNSLFKLDSLKDLNFNKQGKIIPKERPLIMQSFKKKIIITNGVEKIFYIELGVDVNNEPFELFIRPTSSTKDYSVLFNQLGRMISLGFRSNVQIDDIINQLKKVKDWKNEYDSICSIISDTITELINLAKKKGKRRIDEIKEINVQQKNWKLTSKGYYIDEEGNTHCPVCGNEVTIQEGCVTCQSCGWSACS